jgi:F-type H+-transporting ATPase subunit b
MEGEINKAKAAAMEDMQHLAAEIASMAAEKIIGVETDIDQAKTVVRSLKAKAA